MMRETKREYTNRGRHTEKLKQMLANLDSNEKKPTKKKSKTYEAYKAPSRRKER